MSPLTKYEAPYSLSPCLSLSSWTLPSCSLSLLLSLTPLYKNIHQKTVCIKEAHTCLYNAQFNYEERGHDRYIAYRKDLHTHSKLCPHLLWVFLGANIQCSSQTLAHTPDVPDASDVLDGLSAGLMFLCPWHKRSAFISWSSTSWDVPAQEHFATLHT